MSAPLKENKQTNKKATVLPKTDYFKCKVEIVEFIQFFCIISWRGALFPRVFSWCTEVQTTAKVRTEMEWTLPLSVLDIGGPSFPSSLQRTPILSDRLDSMKPQHDWHKRDRPGLNRRAPLLIFLETTHKQTSNQSGFKPFQFLFVIMRSLCPGSGRQRFESSTGHQVPVLLLQEVLKLALRSLEMFRWETVNVDGDVVDNFHQCMTACSWEAALTRLCVGWEGAVTVALSSLGSVPHAWLCVLAAIGCFISWIILLFFHSHPLGILCDHTHTHAQDVNMPNNKVKCINF